MAAKITQETGPENAQWQGPDGLVMERADARNIQASGLKALFAYWTARAAGRMAPSRADIHPRDMAALLPDIVLCDVLDAGHARVRVMGTGISAVVGADLTGQTVSDDPGIDVTARRAMAVVRRVVEHRIPIRATAARFATMHSSIVSVEALWLPLSEDGETVSQILSCSITAEPRAPR